MGGYGEERELPPPVVHRISKVVNNTRASKHASGGGKSPRTRRYTFFVPDENIIVTAYYTITGWRTNGGGGSGAVPRDRPIAGRLRTAKRSDEQRGDFRVVSNPSASHSTPSVGKVDNYESTVYGVLFVVSGFIEIRGSIVHTRTRA